MAVNLCYQIIVWECLTVKDFILARDPSLEEVVVLEPFALLVSDQDCLSLEALGEPYIQSELVLRHDEEMERVALPCCDRMDRDHP